MLDLLGTRFSIASAPNCLCDGGLLCRRGLFSLLAPFSFGLTLRSKFCDSKFDGPAATSFLIGAAFEASNAATSFLIDAFAADNTASPLLKKDSAYPNLAAS